MKLTKFSKNDANLLGNLTHKQLPIKVSYAIAKNISKIEKELEIYNKINYKNNYKYIEIYYTNPTFDIFDSSRIDNPSGKKTSLTVGMRYSEGGAYYTYFRDVSFNGNKITNLYSGYYAVKPDGSIEYFNNNNYISVTKVLGYKKA